MTILTLHYQCFIEHPIFTFFRYRTPARIVNVVGAIDFQIERIIVEGRINIKEQKVKRNDNTKYFDYHVWSVSDRLYDTMITVDEYGVQNLKVEGMALRIGA